MSVGRPLTPKQDRFCEEYVVDLNASRAYRTVYGGSPKAAETHGPRLVGNGRVAVRIAELSRARSERTSITADRVLEELWAIATADANELVEHRRTCCRHCYGVAFLYQHTAHELERRRAAHTESLARKTEKAHKATAAAGGEFVAVVESAPFDEQGGGGYDARKVPNPECPECFGDGVTRVFVKDTRNLSRAARSLYAGVKETKEGIEIKLHDKSGALTLVGKHLRLFTDVVKHEGFEDLADELRQARERAKRR